MTIRRQRRLTTGFPVNPNDGTTYHGASNIQLGFMPHAHKPLSSTKLVLLSTVCTNPTSTFTRLCVCALVFVSVHSRS